MIKKHGSVEAVQEFMRKAQQKSRENYKGTGGFAANKELAKEAGRMGGTISRRGKANVSKDNTSSET